MNYNLNTLGTISNESYSEQHLKHKFEGRPRKHGSEYMEDVAKAHLDLAGEVLDPRTYYKVYKGYQKGKGAVVPGSHYIGPWNPLPQDGEVTKDWLPTSNADYSAYLHDKAYDRMIAEGKNPYKGFSEADQEMINRAKKDLSSKDALAEYYGMLARKAVLPTLK